MAKRIENLKLLSSYGVKNDLDWVVRDLIQNFYDGAKKLGLEDPLASIHMTLEDGKLTISGPSYFSPEYLLFIGATSKAGDNSQIGEKGEGLKMVTLIGMRDYGLKFEFSASNSDGTWIARSFWCPVNIGGKEEQELCFEIETSYDEKSTGSCVTITGDQENLDKIYNMDWRDFFVGGNNSFLCDPITDQIFHANNGHGHMFLAGIDRGIHHGLSFTYVLDRKLQEDNDRDRKTLSEAARNVVLRSIIGGDNDVPKEVYQKLLLAKREEFLKDYSWDCEVRALLDNSRFEEYFLEVYGDMLKNFSYSDDRKSYGMSVIGRLGVVQVEQSKIWTILKKHNIPSIEKLMDGALEGQEINGNVVLQQKCSILMATVGLCGLVPLPIRIIAIDEDSLLLGTFNGTYVRLMDKVFTLPFGKALITYIHELSHVAGPDASQRFEDKLQENMERVFGAIYGVDQISEHFKNLAKLAKQWEKIKMNSKRTVRA